MRLRAFRINNFRSVIDSEWRDMSLDNITVLIGQNESGKTSVLEALNSFYASKLSSDYIRSDGKLPEISCSFEVDSEALNKLLPPLKVIPVKILNKIKDSSRINLKRVWESENTSRLCLEEEDLRVMFAEASEADVLMGPAKVDEAQAEGENKDPSLEQKEPEKPSILTEEEFCKQVFDNIPVFEFFQDFGSLLPDVIDITDIESKKQEVQGYKGARNFLTIADLDLNEIKTGERRIVGNKINRLNKSLTTEFRAFWRQNIGKSNKIGIEVELKHHSDQEGKEIAGKPYLCFWINDGEERLYLKQRSKGVRWFLSFYLQLKASAKEEGREEKKRGRIFLIDEPGGSLHARAQEDVLKLFESLKEKLQIIYTTHSPHLVQLETLYRILAVQRADEDEVNSATLILNAQQLGEASRDTLSPIYTLMGADFSSQTVIQKKNNIILEEISGYYYLTAFWELGGSTREIHFLPANGAFNVPQLAYLFLGWGLSFGVVVDDDQAGRTVYKELRKNIFEENSIEASKKLLKIKDCDGIEDVFSKTDFKKYVISDVTARFSSRNSQYIKDIGLSKQIAGVKFRLLVKENKLKLEDLQSETQNKIKALVISIEAIL